MVLELPIQNVIKINGFSFHWLFLRIAKGLFMISDDVNHILLSLYCSSDSSHMDIEGHNFVVS